MSKIKIVVSRIIEVGIHIGKDGEPKEGKYSVEGALFRAVIVFTLACFTAWELYLDQEMGIDCI